MKRRSIFMDDERHGKLKKEACKQKLKVSELIRRIIDEWLDNRKDDNQ